MPDDYCSAFNAHDEHIDEEVAVTSARETEEDAKKMEHLELQILSNLKIDNPYN